MAIYIIMDEFYIYNFMFLYILVSYWVTKLCERKMDMNIVLTFNISVKNIPKIDVLKRCDVDEIICNK